MSPRSDPPLTKRQLGLLFNLTGLGAAAAILLTDALGGGAWAGLGPAQQLALGAAAALFLLGLTLFPLGDRPA